MKTAAITGVTGQDGALLASMLLKKGYQVIGLIPEDRASDLYRLHYLNISDKIIFRKVDVTSMPATANLLNEFSIDEFYNLAAISSVGISFQRPLDTFEFNTRSVMCILESIRQVSAKTRFYQASSSEMFGNVGIGRLPIVESFLFHPASPYGISKAAAHWLTVNYREAYKLNTCCGILFNHESALRPNNFVIKKIVRGAIQIQRGERDSIQLGNINVVRDWGYAPLYVEAMWMMMQQEVMDDYLICTGIPTKLEAFAEKVFSCLDLNLKEYLQTDHGLLRSLDLEIIYGDNSKAKQQLGWQYELSLDQLVRTLIEDELRFMQWESSKIGSSI